LCIHISIYVHLLLDKSILLYFICSFRKIEVIWIFYYSSESFYVIQHFDDEKSVSVRLPDLLSTELHSRCRVSLGARVFSGMTNREGKPTERRQRIEKKAGRMKSDLTNQREAASISTTHRFFSYPRNRSFSFNHFSLFHFPTCFFYYTFASCE